LVGLVVAPEVMVSLPVRLPVAVGPNVSVTVQLPPGAIDVPQSFACPKSPVVATLVSGIARSGLVLVSVTVFGALVVPTAWLPKLSDVGETVSGKVPVPLNVDVRGLLVAFDTMATEPGRLPVAVGVNVTLTVQLPDGATTPAHSFVAA
jgi:hypothetical protein